jgi:RNA polymerase sigma-70 factor (ECF subfamily)
MMTVETTSVGETAGGDAAAHRGLAHLDEAAFLATYRLLSRPLWSYLYRMLGSAADADDVLQETFLRYVQAPLHGGEEPAIRAYLYRIATNRAIDFLRRRSRDVKRSADEDVADVVVATPDGAEAFALRRDMTRTFRELSPHHRALLWLAYVEGSPHADIAAALGLRKRSVPVLLFRARKKLASLLRRKGLGG